MSRVIDMDKLRHHVYRYYSADDSILYIGCTNDLVARHRQHSAKAEWFPQVVRRSHETFPDKWHGRVAERAAIMVNRPLYNKTFNYWPLESDLACELHSIVANRPDNATELIADIEARAYEDGKRRQHVRDAHLAANQAIYDQLTRMGITHRSALIHARRGSFAS